MNQPTSYKVLARKYRPQSFADLKGQDALVKVITNAIKLGRVHHAFILTGIRGIGKTTTARIIAKTINCISLNLENEIIVPCGLCDNCKNFEKEAHPDVIEIDAASKTGVNDVRELIENSRYLPILGQYKIFIIDEVHMLSTSAFNALLKTLEEPPAHVKFIFATTEIRKVPVTILSRCQRFDLRRFTIEELVENLNSVLKKENLKAEKAALNIIAKFSDGSVRDSLSLLDQAIATNINSEIINSSSVEEFLGITKKETLYELFDQILEGEASKALALTRELHLLGHEASIILNEIMEIVHNVSKFLVVGDNALILSQFEEDKIKYFAKNTDITTLTLIWQILMKTFKEMQFSPNSYYSLEMLIIKLCHLKHLEPLSNMEHNSNKKIEITDPAVAKVNFEPIGDLNSFKDVVNLFYKRKEMIIYHTLYENVHLIEFKPGFIKFRQQNTVPHSFANKVSLVLSEWTNEKWIVTISADMGEDTLSAQDKKLEQEKIEEVAQDDNIKSVLDSFAGAKIVSVNQLDA